MEIPERVTVQEIIRRATRANGAELKDVRTEYSELRKIANKRIKRAHAQGDLLDYEQFMTTKAIMKGVTPVADLAKAYSEVVKFLHYRKSTAAGRKEIRRKTRETLNKLGFKSITDDNVKLFGDFMEKWRVAYEKNTTAGKKLLSDSDLAAEFFDSVIEEVTNDEQRTNAEKLFYLFKKWVALQGV